MCRLRFTAAMGRYGFMLSALAIVLLLLTVATSVQAQNSIDIGITCNNQHDTIWAGDPATFDIDVHRFPFLVTRRRPMAVGVATRRFRIQPICHDCTV